MKRCENCQWCRKIYATGQWSFYGCTHAPYNGKWVAEVKDCPKNAIASGKDK